MNLNPQLGCMSRYIQKMKTAIIAFACPAVIFAHQAFAQMGATWINHSPVGIVSSLQDAVWTGSQFVAVGTDGTLLSSPDGATWADNGLDAGSGVDFYSICQKGSLLVALSSSSTCYTSTDGITWAEQVAIGDPAVDTFAAVAASSSIIIAVGSRYDSDNDLYTEVIYSSSDGATWTQRSALANVGGLIRAIYTGTQFVACGFDGALLTSSNGTSWTKRTTGTTDRIDDIAWSGSKLVATTSVYDFDFGDYLMANHVIVSATGASWATQALPYLNRYADQPLAGRIVWVGDAFLLDAYLNYYDSEISLKSNDGTTWTESGSPPLGINRMIWSTVEGVSRIMLQSSQIYKPAHSNYWNHAT
jgi:hypothetical protein